MYGGVAAKLLFLLDSRVPYQVTSHVSIKPSHLYYYSNSVLKAIIGAPVLWQLLRDGETMKICTL